MQLGQSRPPLGIIFDSDLGNRIDSALALAVLYGLDGKNECRVVSITVSKPSLRAAQFAEIIGRFYSGAVSGAFGAVGRSLPIGLATEGANAESAYSKDTPMMTALLADKKYEHGIHDLNDTAEPHAVIRNAFTSQYDQNCSVVLAGPATNMVAALNLAGTPPWIERKVRSLVWSLTDDAIKCDTPAARKLLAGWPGEIIIAPPELGSAILFPAASIEADFAWSQAHPVADAYRAAGKMPYDAPMWDAIAVLQAVRPSTFQLSEPGTVEIDNGGRMKFTASAKGRHRTLSLDPAKKDEVVKALVELASAKPVVRQRFRPPQQKKQ